MKCKAALKLSVRFWPHEVKSISTAEAVELLKQYDSNLSAK